MTENIHTAFPKDYRFHVQKKYFKLKTCDIPETYEYLEGIMTGYYFIVLFTITSLSLSSVLEFHCSIKRAITINKMKKYRRCISSYYFELNIYKAELNNSGQDADVNHQPGNQMTDHFKSHELFKRTRSLKASHVTLFLRTISLKFKWTMLCVCEVAWGKLTCFAPFFVSLKK